ncbi:MAG: phosphate ABC transporter permease PstA [Flammeovirgaceae bacterium]|nr:phosphate ABC transporter permease PstA [Flammeovirgaceae bacterium]MDW8287679.1 phosphate ABC transporter permease PstA [Flammeovirgaceae bacterium]
MNRKIAQKIVFTLLRLLTFSVIGLVVFIFGFVLWKGLGKISWTFLTAMPANGMTEGGIFPAIVGTCLLVIGSSLFAFPVGLIAGIYMSEYAKDGFIKKFIRLMTNNLAGVPSVVFGLFGLSLFVNIMGLGVSAWAGSLTLGLMILPLIIRTTEESLQFVDKNLRLASYALGAGKLRTILNIVLPAAAPNILTGFIIAIGRVAGETAPIIFTAAVYFIPTVSFSFWQPVMALPYHLYVTSTSGIDLEKSRELAFGTAFVLITIVLILNIIASLIRQTLSKNLK